MICIIQNRKTSPSVVFYLFPANLWCENLSLKSILYQHCKILLCLTSWVNKTGCTDRADVPPLQSFLILTCMSVHPLNKQACHVWWLKWTNHQGAATQSPFLSFTTMLIAKNDSSSHLNYIKVFACKQYTATYQRSFLYQTFCHILVKLTTLPNLVILETLRNPYLKCVICGIFLIALFFFQY